MLHVIVLLQFSINVAFPYFHYIVALAPQVLDLFHGRTMKFLHGVTADRAHCIAGVTSRTSVPETTVDFIRGVCFLMVPVEQIRANTFFAAVTRVLNTNFVLFSRVRQQPFMGKQRLIVLGGISRRRNDGDRIFRKVVGAIHEMTGRGVVSVLNGLMSVTS